MPAIKLAVRYGWYKQRLVAFSQENGDKNNRWIGREGRGGEGASGTRYTVDI